jgi:hypothetical protein
MQVGHGLRRGVAWVIAGLFVLALPSGAAAAKDEPRRMGQLEQLPQPDTWSLGIFDPLGSQLDVTKRYYGLRHTDTWLDLFVQNDAGQWFVTAQHLSDAICSDLTVADLAVTQPDPDCGIGPNYHMAGFNLGLLSQPAGLAMVPNPQWRPWTPGNPTQEILPDDHVKWTIPTLASTESLVYGPQRIQWASTDGAIDLTGTLTAPGSWYYLPTPREAGTAKSDMFYDNAYYRVTGTYSGQHVSGHVIIENMWGNTPYDKTWWVHNRKQNWIAFTTSYADGTTEYGQLYCGKYGSRGVVISNNHGELVDRSYKVNATLDEVDSVGTPQKIRYQWGDQQWVYTGDPKATLLPSSSASLSLGNVAKVGETRKIVSSSAVQLTNGEWCAPEQFAPAAKGEQPHAALRIGRVRVHGRRVRVALRLTGGALGDVRVVLRRGKRTLRQVTLAHLDGRTTITLRAGRRLARGRYKIIVLAPGIRRTSRTFSSKRRRV